MEVFSDWKEKWSQEEFFQSVFKVSLAQRLSSYHRWSDTFIYLKMQLAADTLMMLSRSDLCIWIYLTGTVFMFMDIRIKTEDGNLPDLS